MVDRKSVATVLWRSLRAPGMERFDLLRHPEGWTLRGTILVLADSGPAEAGYEVRCDAAWRTTGADVRLRDEAGERVVGIAVSGSRWSRNGREEEPLRGCVDVDLAWSPSTNTLPIRRLALAVGARREVTAAWVRFPELTLEPLAQEYERLAEQRYRYTSAGGTFTAVLDVDDDGVVLEYAGGWQRVM
jgi:uncharacterized protein